MATFPSTVNGYRASSLFDPQSPFSTVSSSVSLQLNIQRRKVGIPVRQQVSFHVLSSPNLVLVLLTMFMM
jgi:hypothetical protein